MTNEDVLKNVCMGSYSQADLLTLGGISRGEFDQWLKRGIISGEVGGGRGHHRKFSLFNLLEARVAKTLSDGLKMQTGQIEFVMNNIRTNLNELAPDDGFPAQSLFFGDWTAIITPRKNDVLVYLNFGGVPADALVPVLAAVNLSRVAQDLLDAILDEPNGSKTWYTNALAARKTRGFDYDPTKWGTEKTYSRYKTVE